jgi:hypothetical protein
MDQRLFELTKMGACAYFLVLYSCMQILQELWYSPVKDDLTGYLISFAVPALMLSGGIYLSKLLKKKRIDLSEEEGLFLTAADRFIGGWAILAIVLKYIVTFYLFIIMSGNIDLKAFWFPLVFYGPFLIAAAWVIRKSSLKKQEPSSADRIKFLCLRIVLINFIILGIHQILVWFGPYIITTPHYFSPYERNWIMIEIIVMAAALIVIFAPLRRKLHLKNTDGQVYKGLLRQSFILSGHIISIVGLAKLCNALIGEYDSFFFLFFELDVFLVQLIPPLFLVIVGLCLIFYKAHLIQNRNDMI